MKRKINIDRPNLSSQEIASRQDFSSLMNQLPKVTKPPFYKTGWFITTVASVTGIAVITTYFVLNEKTSTPNQELTASVSTATPPPSESVSPLIASNQMTDPEQELEVSFVSNVEMEHEVESGEPGTQNEVSEKNEVNIDQNIEVLKSEMLSAKMAYEEALNARLAFEKTQPQAPVNKGNPERQFVLDVNPKDFPELALYKNLLFEVEENDPNFSPTVYDEEWEDIQLKTKQPGKTYYLSLFRGNVSKTFSVFPVYQGSNYTTAMSQYEQALQTYQAELQEKKSKEEKLKALYKENLDQLNALENQETDLSKTN